MEDAKIVEILLVEDNPGDVLLTQKALLHGKVANRLTVAKDGEEAVAILRRNDDRQPRDWPDLILLDLNLPKKDGCEVLAEIKSDPDLRRLPVVILTSSQAEVDVLKCYNLHANGYIIKPIDMEQFIRVIKALEDFWFQVVRLPNKA